MLTQLIDLSKEELRKRARKIVLYALIGLVIVLAVVAAVNFARGMFLASKVSVLETELSQVKEANRSLADSVSTIRQLRELDSEVLGRLSETLSGQLKRDSTLRTQIEILETTNETARAYLDAPIHPDVARLLQDDSNGTNRSGTAQEPAGGVPTRPER